MSRKSEKASLGTIILFVMVSIVWHQDRVSSGSLWSAALLAWPAGFAVGWIIFPHFFSRSDAYHSSDYRKLTRRLQFCVAWGCGLALAVADLYVIAAK